MDLNIIKKTNLFSPKTLINELPLTDTLKKFISSSRKTVEDIISYRSNKLLVVVGPCSIHDEYSALEYATKLAALKKKFNNLFIVMRVYFEKPRTRVGWKGLINDPDLDNTLDIQKGLRTARRILININKIGLPTACEFLDTITPQYFSDLVSWGAIGARTVNSQIHRQLASGLSMPIGFKNFTNNDYQIAIDGIISSFQSHTFPGINDDGSSCLFITRGNKYNHLILRGGKIPNYYQSVINKIKKDLVHEKINNKLIIDCSHGNSGKDYKRQPVVCKNIANQIKNGETVIGGVMIESHIKEGKQSFNYNKKDLEYGKSITDSCVSLETTEMMLSDLNNSLENKVFMQPNTSLDAVRQKIDNYQDLIEQLINNTHHFDETKLLKSSNRYEFNKINIDIDELIITPLLNILNGFNKLQNQRLIHIILEIILDRIYLGMNIAEIKFNENPFLFIKNSDNNFMSLIENKERENNILNNLNPILHELFNKIILYTKQVQNEYLIKKIKSLSIGYLGPQGTFSYDAVNTLNKNIKKVSFISFQEMIGNLKTNIDYVLIPNYNNITGDIKHNIKIDNLKNLGKFEYKINIDLLTENITHNKIIIYSHNQAYLEVKDYLNKYYPQHKFVSTSSTLEGCNKAKELKGYALASSSNISGNFKKINQDIMNDNNYTTFVLYS